MKNLKQRIPKHIALPLLAGLIIFLVFTLFRVQAHKNDWSIELHDISGTRAALSDVLISGQFRDGFHLTNFTINQEEVTTSTEVFGQPYQAASYPSHFGVKYDDLEYRITNMPGQIDIHSIDHTDPTKPDIKWSRIRPEVSNIYTRQSSYTNQIEYGLTKVKDRMFFTIPTTKHDVGMNGIYVLDFYFGLPNHYNHRSLSQRIVDLPLEVNRNQPRLSVLGLETVGDRLALILVDDERLVVQAYDTDGTLIGEAVVPGFTLPDAERETKSDAIVHYESYEAFSDEEGSTLTLSFRSTESTAEEAVFTYLSFDLSDDVKWIGEAKGRYSSDSIQYDNQLFAQQIGDRLIVLRTLSFGHERIRLSIYMKKFIVEVYEHGQLIYQGELVTDVNDDLIEAMNQYATSYGLDRAYHRQLYNVQIKSAQ